MRGLNVRSDTVKLLAEIRGRISFDINHSIFFNASPKAREIKAKTNKWDLIKLKSFAQQRKPLTKKTNDCMGQKCVY